MFVLLLIFSTLGLSGCATSARYCSDDWRVTGYFTPVESDFSVEKQKIFVEEQGYQQISKAFLSAVKLEGWGRTRFGWYLGFYSQKWHRADFPKNAQGCPLTIGQVATDSRKIPPNAQVSIQGLKRAILAVKQNNEHFVSTDVGSRIRGKKIDVYTGEGKSAQALTYQITGNYRVCYAGVNQLPPVISI